MKDSRGGDRERERERERDREDQTDRKVMRERWKEPTQDILLDDPVFLWLKGRYRLHFVIT